MTGLAACDSGDDAVVLMLMASAKVGIVSGMAGDTGAAMSAIDALVWSLQRSSALGIDMAGAAVIAALVVDGVDIMGVVGKVALVVTDGALGAGSDLAHGDVVYIAMAGLVVVVADNAGDVKGAGHAVGDGVVYCCL